MFSLLKEHPRAVLWAVIVHVIFLIAMGVSFHFVDAPSVSSSEVKIVKAVLMDDSIEQQKLKKKLEKQRRAAERKRKAKIKKEKARLKKLKYKAELKKKKAAKVAADKKRAAQKKQIEEENKRQIEAENKRIEKERQQKQREDKLKKELEEEQQRLSAEREVRNATIISKQLARIKAHIEQHWNRPASTKPGMVSVIKISLIPSGEVINVQYIKRSGNSAFDLSVYAAVKKASPLPLPPVEYGLSDKFRDIVLNFGEPT